MRVQLTPVRIVVIVLVATGISAILFNTQVLSETFINITLKTNPDLEGGLVGHWTFDGKDMVTNVNDRSSSNNDGTLQGQTSTTTAIGVVGQALEFDGVDDYVERTMMGIGIMPHFYMTPQLTQGWSI